MIENVKSFLGHIGELFRDCFGNRWSTFILSGNALSWLFLGLSIDHGGLSTEVALGFVIALSVAVFGVAVKNIEGHELEEKLSGKVFKFSIIFLPPILGVAAFTIAGFAVDVALACTVFAALMGFIILGSIFASDPGRNGKRKNLAMNTLFLFISATVVVTCLPALGYAIHVPVAMVILASIMLTFLLVAQLHLLKNKDARPPLTSKIKSMNVGIVASLACCLALGLSATFLPGFTLSVSLMAIWATLALAVASLSLVCFSIGHFSENSKSNSAQGSLKGNALSVTAVTGLVFSDTAICDDVLGYDVDWMLAAPITLGLALALFACLSAREISGGRVYLPVSSIG